MVTDGAIPLDEARREEAKKTHLTPGPGDAVVTHGAARAAGHLEQAHA